MHPFIHVFGRGLPTYGLLITLGIILANILAIPIIKKKRYEINDFIILEAYCGLGAFLGAKGFYLLTVIDVVDWNLVISDYSYFAMLMQGGYVFYGGFIGAILLIFVAGKIHAIRTSGFLKDFICLIPFVHGFGRLGCFMAGCCYGIPYDGFGSVVFPAESYAPSGIALFPVQLMEAILVFIIWGVLYTLTLKAKEWNYSFEVYLIAYAVIRFVLEFFRYDKERGIFWGLSTSQWIAIAMFVIGWIVFTVRFRKDVRTLDFDRL